MWHSTKILLRKIIPRPVRRFCSSGYFMYRVKTALQPLWGCRKVLSHHWVGLFSSFHKWAQVCSVKKPIAFQKIVWKMPGPSIFRPPIHYIVINCDITTYHCSDQSRLRWTTLNTAWCWLRMCAIKSFPPLVHTASRLLIMHWAPGDHIILPYIQLINSGSQNTFVLRPSPLLADV